MFELVTRVFLACRSLMDNSIRFQVFPLIFKLGLCDCLEGLYNCSSTRRQEVFGTAKFVEIDFHEWPLWPAA